MKTNQKFLGALFVAVVGGCAGTRSTVVTLSPTAQGVPVDATSYDLTVDGAPGGRVVVRDGQLIRDRGQELIQLVLDIDNRTSDRTFRLPTDQIWLSNVGPQTARLIQVDRAMVPSAIEVPAGHLRTCMLTFMPAQPVAMRRIVEPNAHWTLLIDGATEPVARTTPLIALRGDVIPGRKTADVRNYDLPGSALRNPVPPPTDRPLGRTTGRQTLRGDLAPY